MKIDYGRIKDAFPGKAWAYAEQIDCVKLGKWDGNKFNFCEPVCMPIDEQYLLVLRVFDNDRELMFSGGKYRDTADYENYITELASARYLMYGENAGQIGEYTKLWEDRGGILYFPAKLRFPGKRIALQLGVKNFVRYNPVSVLLKGAKYDDGIGASGAGALEVFDYAYTGFFYTNGRAVEL